MKIIRIIVLSVVLALMSSSNLWATRYIFYFKDSNGMFHFMSAKSGGYPGTVKSSHNPSDQSDYIWYCKSSYSTSSSDATIGTDETYFYATYDGTNYWLRTASGNANQARITSSSGSAETYSLNGGYLREESNSYYLYYQESDSTWRTSNTPSNYNNKRPSYIEYTGNYINKTIVKSYPESGGYVYVTGDIDRGFSGTRTSDDASRKYPAVFYMYASPKSGYVFIGWSKTQGGTIESTATTYMVSVVSGEVTYYANYKPTYVVHFHPHNEMETGHSVTGSMADATFTCDIDGTLPANTFVNTITTTFDGDGGQLKNTSGTFVNSYTVTQTATFREWTDSANFNPRTPKKTYSDKGTINRSGLTELNLYACWNNKGVTYPEGKRGDRTLIRFDNWRKTGDISYPNTSYTIKAVWSDPFYAAMTATNTTGASGTPTVDQAKKSSDSKGSNSGTATFALTAKAANSGYHFNKWTGTGITFSAATSLTTNATVAVSSTAGESNAASYTATANYEQNTYYAALTATSGGNGVVTVDSSPKSTTTSGGDIDFNLTITPSSGYHFDKIEFTTGSGSITGSKVTVSASSNYAVEGDNKAAQYAVKVTFAKDMYNAQLTTAVSTAGTGTSTGTAQVSADGGTSYVASAKKSVSTSGGDVVFRIKATPNTGYQFKGWSETNGSTTYKSTKAETDYTVKGHTTIGQTQEYNLYSVFDHGTYTVKFDGNGATSGSMSDQTFTHGTAMKLTKNAYVNNFTVTYNTQGGNPINSKSKSRFNYWKCSSNKYYNESLLDTTVAHNSTLTFTAQWKSSVSFTLPTPTKTAADGTEYAFLGWYDDATGGNKVGDAGETKKISATRTLYAHWQDYNILIKASWSSVSTGDKAVFSVTRSGNPAITYYISVPIGGSTASKTLKDVVPGTWTVTPVTQWTWNYNNPAAQSKTLTAGTNTFDFTFTSKGSTKKHDEKSGTVTP